MATANILTPQNKESFFLKNKDKLCVIIFDAEFSGQNDIVQDALRHLEKFVSENESTIALAFADGEINSDLITEFSMLYVPGVVCVTGEKRDIVKKIDTLEPNKLIQILREVHNKSNNSSSSTGGVYPKDRLKEYLKSLTSRSPVMIFMKGHPGAPRCGFSKQLVALLAKYDIKYDYFDILEDEDVRQGLKEYSDWPTYPQIYVKGEFVGGLDILKQLDDAGELMKTLSV